MGQQSPNDAHYHRIEEKRHREHMEIRAKALHGDSTIEAGETQLAEIRHRREVKRLQDALRDAQEQLLETR
ncbi:MAG TPA: hypothetical protein P5195_09120 [Anaerolineae bacterium]|jgi:hypothetical protein|nr:hypothetical protein [Anaerolineae bacterium]